MFWVSRLRNVLRCFGLTGLDFPENCWGVLDYDSGLGCSWNLLRCFRLALLKLSEMLLRCSGLAGLHVSACSALLCSRLAMLPFLQCSILFRAIGLELSQIGMISCLSLGCYALILFLMLVICWVLDYCEWVNTVSGCVCCNLNLFWVGELECVLLCFVVFRFAIESSELKARHTRTT